MFTVYLAIAAVFLPLFPMSMIFNNLYARFSTPLPRILFVLCWPQIGLVILSLSTSEIPSWIVPWAILTSILYAWRMLTLRDIGLWIGFMATSGWSLIWLMLDDRIAYNELHVFIIGICLPLVILTMLGAGLSKRYGAAYLGLYGGIADAMPRFTGIFVVSVLAVIATPLFPAFSLMLYLMLHFLPASPWIAFGIAMIWMLWSWAGARLLSGLIVGESNRSVADISRAVQSSAIVVLIGLVAMALFSLGAMQ